MGKKAKKYYAVKKGFKPGIYSNWNECKAQTDHFKGSLFKKFDTLSEAQEFMEHSDKKDNSSPDINLPTYAYIDGSFNKYRKIYGYGGYIIYNNQKYIIQGSGNEEKYAKMRNVGGEILASKETIKKAIELGIKDIDIFYDYSGIEEWAKGRWKRNLDSTKEYYEFFQSIKSKININFKKVKGHSGNEGNDEADRLAKESAFIKCENDELFYEDEDNDDNEEEKRLDNKTDISLFEKKHIIKNIERKNKINIIQNFNYKNDKMKKEYTQKIKSSFNKEKLKEK